MNNFILVECSDHDKIYGIMESDMNEKQLQEEIYKVKSKLNGKGFSDWTIENIVEKLNEKGFTVGFTPIDKKIEI